MATILGANTLSSGYSIDNSCRFYSNTKMVRTNASTSTNRTQGCFSTWIKKCNPSGTGGGIITGYVDANNFSVIYFDGDHRLCFLEYVSGSAAHFLRAPNLFRDPSAWMHIAYLIDTTQGTAANRIKLYINGTQITSFHSGGTTQPDQNDTLLIFTQNSSLDLGQDTSGSPHMLNAYLADTLLVDGATVAIDDLGEFDEDSPNIWKPKDISAISVGTNGFRLDYQDSANLGNAADGGTDLTETNLAATDQATDTPTNNFCTLNPLENYHAGGTFAEGNTYYTSVSSKHDFAISTMAMPAGKWYAEFKIHQDTDYNIVGITDHGYQGSNQELSEDNYSYGFANYDASKSIVRGNGSTTIDNMPLFGNGDIIGVAVDITNSKLYFSKNGTFINSGDPTSGSTGTGAQSIQDLSSGSGTSYGQDVYFFGIGLWNTSAAGNYSANFGNAPFSISSGNADGNGYGNFEYSVPSGYYALCTKNLAEYG